MQVEASTVTARERKRKKKNNRFLLENIFNIIQDFLLIFKNNIVKRSCFNTFEHQKYLRYLLSRNCLAKHS